MSNAFELPEKPGVAREAIVIAVLISAVMLLIWNGSDFFHELQVATQFSREIQVASTALTLNVALILFGWRRYVDLQHETEQREEHLRRIAVLASTDPATGLLNRKGFSDRVEDMVESDPTGEKRLIVLSILVHRFKSVNDQHGFEVGDELLKRIAALLTEDFGPDACIGRLGGDELAIALAIDPIQESELDGRTSKMIRSITRPFFINDKVIQVGAFAGIASGDKGARIPDIMRRADIALDRACSGRKSRPVWFDAGMERALIAQGEMEQNMRFGLENGQFEPYFEPQVDLSTGEVVGFEVLARWNHPLSGMISPEVFIPVAEDMGLIGKLSEHIIAEALRSAADWDPAIKISVNVSPQQLSDGWLAQKFVKILAETGFPAERLVCEITESSLFQDLELARSVTSSLKNQGIRLALDDFGTGYSSLSHLRSLPFDIIKIDRSFVSTIESKKESAAVVKAVTTLASALNVPVCIEGIENEAAFHTVLTFGCAVGQGWYLGKPMRAEEARDYLDAHRRQGAEEQSSAVESDEPKDQMRA